MIGGVVELDGPCRSTGKGDGRGEQPVVGPDEDPGAVADLDGDRLAARADAWIDDREHDTVGDVGDRPSERQRSGAHVEGPDPVSEVDRGDVRGELANHGLHDAGELVVESVVGEQADGFVAAPHGQQPTGGCRWVTPDATRADANPPMAPALVGAARRTRRVSTGGSLRRE